MQPDIHHGLLDLRKVPPTRPWQGGASVGKRDGMGDGTNDLTERVEAVKARMDQDRVSIDQRFDTVDAALVEQRQYTEFAFDSLKIDIAGVKGELKADIAAVRGELAGVRGEVLGAVGRLERKPDQFIDRFVPPPAA